MEYGPVPKFMPVHAPAFPMPFFVSPIGIILVLFILLVIVLRCVVI